MWWHIYAYCLSHLPVSTLWINPFGALWHSLSTLNPRAATLQENLTRSCHDNGIIKIKNSSDAQSSTKQINGMCELGESAGGECKLKGHCPELIKPVPKVEAKKASERDESGHENTRLRDQVTHWNHLDAEIKLPFWDFPFWNSELPQTYSEAQHWKWSETSQGRLGQGPYHPTCHGKQRVCMLDMRGLRGRSKMPRK